MGNGVEPHYRPRTDTVVRSLRTSRALWDRARERAQKRGETVNDVLNRALQQYVDSKPE